MSERENKTIREWLVSRKWVVSQSDDLEFPNLFYIDFELMGKEMAGARIAEIYNSHRDVNDAEEKANLIVQAVNSHSLLIEALEGVLSRYTGLANSGDCGNWDCEEEEQVINARAALKSARGDVR